MLTFLSCLVAKISSMDFLVNFINTVLGAFLGFFFVLFIEGKTQKKKRLESIENIKDELRDFKTILSTGSDKNSKELPSPFVYSIYTPIWDAIQSNGDLLQFRDKVYYNDLIYIYELILKWMKIENWAFENYKSIDEIEKANVQDNLILVRNQIYNILTSETERDGHIYKLLLNKVR